jgi:predicted HAD superfamily Cof-like phosphohydrolase
MSFVDQTTHFKPVNNFKTLHKTFTRVQKNRAAKVAIALRANGEILSPPTGKMFLMQTEISNVTQFHQLIGEKVSTDAALIQTDPEHDLAIASDLRQLIATVKSDNRRGSHLRRRVLMAVEELAEWIEAHVAGDLNSAADALGDRLYVLLGDAVASGLPLQSIFDEVHRSNMTKVASQNQDGKGVKSESFEQPDFRKLL